MYCILNSTHDHFDFIGLRPKPFDRILFDYFLKYTKSTNGLFGPVAATFIANLAIERRDFHPYVYYLNDAFHGLEDMCELANEHEKPFVQPELFDYPYLPWDEPCVACDITSNHAYFTRNLVKGLGFPVMAIQIIKLR